MKTKMTAAEFRSMASKGANRKPKNFNFKGEDAVQFRCLQWLKMQYPDLVYYGNATANIFQSPGSQKLTKAERLAIKTKLGADIYNWAQLISYALKSLGLRMSYKKVEKGAEGAKIHAIQKTQALGAKKSWPDVFIYEPFTMDIHTGGGQFEQIQFHGIAQELKDPKAGTLPYGKHDIGKLSRGEHIMSQAICLSDLCRKGYLALFSVGDNQFMFVVNQAMGRVKPSLEGPYIERQVFSDPYGQKRWIYRLRNVAT